MPTPSGQRVISARVPYADTVIRGSESTLSLQLERDGVGVLPDAAENVQFLDQGGTVLVEGTPLVELGSGRMIFTIPGATSSSWTLGELFQTRWFVRVDGETDPRVFRRPAVVASFVLAPPISDRDLTEGNYPDLVDQLAAFAETGENGESTLQPYIDEAWNVILRKLFKVNRWPDLLFSVEDLVEPLREEAWTRCFRFLYSRTGEASRFEILWKDHERKAEDEWNTISARWDQDGDGLPDGEERDSANGAIHPNAAPRRRLRGRW